MSKNVALTALGVGAEAVGDDDRRTQDVERGLLPRERTRQIDGRVGSAQPKNRQLSFP